MAIYASLRGKIPVTGGGTHRVTINSALSARTADNQLGSPTGTMTLKAISHSNDASE